MENEPQAIEKEDYEEPRCPLAAPSDVTPIPIGRVIEKLDAYFAKGDAASAARHLQYWLREAELGNDLRGQLTVVNEQMGLYRKTAREAEALAAASAALEILHRADLEDSVTAGTTLVNVATVYKAFGKPAEALPLYERAAALYTAHLTEQDERFGGLYNNMALAVTELGEYARAYELFERALDVMRHTEHGEAEQAITYCNLADLAVARDGIENAETTVAAYMEQVERLLDTEDLPRDGNYAFVCEKCAPVVGAYGYFAYEQELNRRAREIYERT